MKKIIIINGPNLNLLGNREKNVYGEVSIEDIEKQSKDRCKKLDIELFFCQSNNEGEIINYIQSAEEKYDGLIINPAAFTHTSVALLDALRALSIAIFIFSPPSMFMSIVFGITFGLLWLSTVPPTNGIVAQIFGTKYLSSLFGIVFLSHQAGAFIGAYYGGYFFDVFGSYDYAFYIAIALSIFATIVHYPINESPLLKGKQPA